MTYNLSPKLLLITRFQSAYRLQQHILHGTGTHIHRLGGFNGGGTVRNGLNTRLSERSSDGDDSLSILKFTNNSLNPLKSNSLRPIRQLNLIQDDTQDVAKTDVQGSWRSHPAVSIGRRRSICQLVTEVGRRHFRSADVHTCTVSRTCTILQTQLAEVSRSLRNNLRRLNFESDT